ncbi:MAG: GNAT family N-acetyltransferase [Nanoarchaeota archaeon]|nr:GNAT family N-acetyltransferase [Nanoarchaeota archaeon]
MVVKLIKINKDNWKDAVNLKISDDHRNYVTSNLFSIAQVQFYPGMNIYGVYLDEVMIGFVMYGVDDFSNDKRFWIWRMMIAEDYRCKGYGEESLKLIINDAINKGLDVLVLSVLANNNKAISLYKKLGFKRTGNIIDSEDEYLLDLK